MILMHSKRLLIQVMPVKVKIFLKKFSALPAFLFISIFIVSAPVFSQNTPEETKKEGIPESSPDVKKDSGIKAESDKISEPKTNTKKLKVEEYEYFIQWEEVKGNNGYAVQVKDLEENIIVDTTVLTNSFEFGIPLGEYKIRIAALNKFGKPSEWTKWDPFTVDKETAKPKRNIWKKTKKILPCLGLYDVGKPYYGTGCVSLLAGLGGLFYYEKRAGDRLAEKTLNDPDTLTILSYYQPLLLSYKMYEDKKRDRKKYDRHQRNQAAIGATAALIYAAYIFYIYDGFGLLTYENYEPDIRDKTEDLSAPLIYSHNNVFEYRYTFYF